MRRWLVLGVGFLLVVAVAAQELAIPPLPPTATGPVPDRASLEDPTQEVSTSAVLSAPLPRREKAVPYARQGIPEPQEHRGSTGTEIPPESTVPVTGTPRPVAPIS